MFLAWNEKKIFSLEVRMYSQKKRRNPLPPSPPPAKTFSRKTQKMKGDKRERKERIEKKGERENVQKSYESLFGEKILSRLRNAGITKV